MSVRSLVGVIVLCGAALSAAAIAGAQGTATNPKIWVNSTIDAPDAKPGDGICRAKLLAKPGTKPRCTLRAAIQTANSRFGADIVVLPAGTFTLTRKGVGEGSARTGDLDVTSGPLVLLGKGPGVTVIDANGIDRVLEIQPFGGILTLRNVELRGGSAPTGEDGGGAILVAGALYAGNVVFRENTAAGPGSEFASQGGAVLVEKGATAEFDRAAFVDNAAGIGAALSVAGSATLRNTTVSRNFGSSPALGSSLAVRDSLRLVHSTIVTQPGWGSAIRYMTDRAKVELYVSIVVGQCNAQAGQFLGNGNVTTEPDCAPYFTGTTNGVSDTVFADVGIEPLSDGPMPVHPLRAGSPAIDRGRSLTEFCPPSDALGQARPFGRACDAGAVEYRLRRTAG